MGPRDGGIENRGYSAAGDESSSTGSGGSGSGSESPPMTSGETRMTRPKVLENIREAMKSGGEEPKKAGGGGGGGGGTLILVAPGATATATAQVGGIHNGGYVFDAVDVEQTSSNARSKIQGSVMLQVIFGIIASIGHASIGTANAYSSLALVSLKRSNNPDFQPSEQEEAWIGSLLPVGALAGSVVAGFLQQRFGSVGAMKAAAVPFAVGWGLIGFAWRIWVILAGRVLCGFAIGVLAPASPTYICEIAESRIRGALASINQLTVTGGILLTYGVGAGLEWDWTARVCAVIPIIFFASLLLLPESPVWLLQNGRRDDAVRSLQTIRRYDTARHPELAAKAIEAEISDIEQNILRVRQQAAIEAEARKGSVVDPTLGGIEEENGSGCCQRLSEKVSPSIKMFLHRGVMRPLLVCWGLFFCQQMGGASIVIFYTGSIFKNATTKVNESLATVIVGVVQFCATIVSTVLLDRLGRRPLLLTSVAFMGASMASLGGFYYYKDVVAATPEDAANVAWLPLASLVAYIIFYSVGLGPIPWFFIAELFPERARGFAGSLGAASNLVLSFVTLFLFSFLQKWMHQYGTFWLFAACCVVGFAFIFFGVPETKGKTLEEIELYFSRPKTPKKTSGNKFASAILRRRRKSSSIALAAGVAGSGGSGSNSTSSNESLADSGNLGQPYPTTLPSPFDSKLVGFKHNFDMAF